jgi:hypothetical protein
MISTKIISIYFTFFGDDQINFSSQNLVYSNKKHVMVRLVKTNNSISRTFLISPKIKKKTEM